MRSENSFAASFSPVQIPRSGRRPRPLEAALKNIGDVMKITQYRPNVVKIEQPGKHTTCVYFSERGIPLVFTGEPDEDAPTLTVENYMKWYTLYAVFPDYTVKPICWGAGAEPWHGQKYEIEFADHCPRPSSVLKFVESTGYSFCGESESLILARYLHDIRDISDETECEVKRKLVPTREPVAYMVGVLSQIEHGFTDGPFPTLDECLTVNGGIDSVIVKNGTEEILYKWNAEKHKWEKVT